MTPENIKIKVGTTLILPVVLFGCGTWSLTLGEEHRLRVFQNTVLGRYLGIRRRKEQETGENCIMRSIMIGTAHRILLE